MPESGKFNNTTQSGFVSTEGLSLSDGLHGACLLCFHIVEAALQGLFTNVLISLMRTPLLQSNQFF